MKTITLAERRAEEKILAGMHKTKDNFRRLQYKAARNRNFHMAKYFQTQADNLDTQAYERYRSLIVTEVVEVAA